MKRAVCIVVVACACSRTPASTWIDIDAGAANVKDAVAAEARSARAHGLVPVLYLSASYTTASASFERMRATRDMEDALAGIALIRVEPPLDGGAYAALQRGYWHSFHPVDTNGEPTGPALDPGTKDGPCADGVAASCAAWIRPFMRSLR